MRRSFFFIAALSSIAFSQVSYLVKSDSNGIHQILNYNLQSTIQSQIEYINMLVNQKVYMEFHVGAGYIRDIREVGYASVNFCPIHTKVPFVTDIRAKIFRIRELSRILGDSLSPASQAMLRSIESKLDAYNEQKWTRFSFGLVFPFKVISTDTSYYYAGTVNGNSVYAQRTNVSKGIFFLDAIGCCLGYDIGDFGTLNAGFASFSKMKVFLGYSMDFSTPIYSLMVPFINSLKSWFGTSLPNSQDIFLRNP